MRNKKYLLQLGLGLTILYAGVDAFLHPADWIGFLPAWITMFKLTPALALQIHSILEIALGLALLVNYKVRYVAALSALDIALILFVSGFGRNALLITFRDIGLFFLALYLALKPHYG
jgi:uncharacterized membrane protein